MEEGDSVEAERDRRDVERLKALTDAVFAIAITLLVLEFKVPHLSGPHESKELGNLLRDHIPLFISYFVTFLIIAIYWIAHKNMIRYVRHANSVLIWLNLFFLLFIAFLPFPAHVQGDYPDVSLAVVLYAACLCLVGGALSLMWWYASSDYRLIDRDLTRRQITFSLLRALVAPCVFLVSIPIALFNPALAELWWLLIIPITVLLWHLQGGEAEWDRLA